MLWIIIIVVLLVLWLLGLNFAGAATRDLMRIMLVVAGVALILRVALGGARRS